MWDCFDDMVLEFIQDYPLIAQYIKESAQEYDPVTGEVSGTTLEIPVQAIMLDLTLNSNGLSTRFGTQIVDGDKQLLVRPPHKTDAANPVLQVDPSKDRVRVAGIEYKIVTFKEVNPTGTDAKLYDLYLRR